MLIFWSDLTGAHPEPASASASLAGTTHDLELRTAYYTTTIPIWLDLVSAPSDWASSFLSDEAKEVLEVLGGIVVVFAIPPETSTASPSKDETTALIKEVGKVVKEGLGGWEWDGVSIAVGVGDVGHLDDLDTWDEICGDAGLEFVHVAAAAVGTDARNEFGGELHSLPIFVIMVSSGLVLSGPTEKVGVPRVLEALESSDWAAIPGVSGSDLGLLDDDETQDADLEDGSELDIENMDFGFDREDFEGLKKAIWEAKMEREDLGGGEDKAIHQGGEASGAADTGKDEDGDDDDIRKVEQMMQKLQAVRDMSAGLPEEQRKRMAAKAVGEVMRDL